MQPSANMKRSQKNGSPSEAYTKTTGPTSNTKSVEQLSGVNAQDVSLPTISNKNRNTSVDDDQDDMDDKVPAKPRNIKRSTDDESMMGHHQAQQYQSVK